MKNDKIKNLEMKKLEKKLKTDEKALRKLKGSPKRKKIPNKLKILTIKIFAILKFLEIFTVALFTVGAYWYGVLFFYLINWARPMWLMTWAVGFSLMGLTVLLLGLVFLILRKWLVSNWIFAYALATDYIKRRAK